MRSFLAGMLMLLSTAATAEMVKVPWHSVDGAFTNNFMNGAPEERSKIKADGELIAEIIRPRGTKGPIPFVIMLHGCSGMNKTLKTWAHGYGGKIVAAGYGVLILDSFTTRGVGADGICPNSTEKQQNGWSNRRSDDAYAALDYLVEKGIADPKRVYLLGRSNGATAALTALSRYGKYLFAGAFAMQPSCAQFLRTDFYSPLYLFLAEKDDWTSPVICETNLVQSRVNPVGQVKVWKDATHAYEDKGSTVFHGHRLVYNPEAAEGTIKAIIETLNSRQAKP